MGEDGTLVYHLLSMLQTQVLIQARAMELIKIRSFLDFRFPAKECADTKNDRRE